MNILKSRESFLHHDWTWILQLKVLLYFRKFEKNLVKIQGLSL